MKNRLFALEDDLQKRLRDNEFKKLWQKSEPEYRLARMMIEKRLACKISQRALARKAKTTQAVISRLENMSANPSLSLLKRIAQALGTQFQIQVR